MRHPFGLTLTAAALVAAAAPLPCSAQARLSYDRSGLGLKQQIVPATDAPSADGAAHALPTRFLSDFSLYGGARELLRPGPAAAEAYGGIAYTLTRGLGSSLEAAYSQETLFQPRRYSLTAQVHAAFSGSRSLSLGFHYSIFDTDATSRFGEAAGGYSYSLAPSRVSGAGPAPGYQLQLSYQHSAASTFGLALGRDMELIAPYYYDPTANGLRQLAFTGQHWLTESWALSYDVLSGDLASPSPLRLQGMGLRLGVRYRF